MGNSYRVQTVNKMKTYFCSCEGFLGLFCLSEHVFPGRKRMGLEYYLVVAASGAMLGMKMSGVEMNASTLKDFAIYLPVAFFGIGLLEFVICGCCWGKPKV